MHIAQGLDKTVRLYAGNTATVSVPGKRTLTWEEFRERTGRLAGALRELGLEPGARAVKRRETLPPHPNPTAPPSRTAPSRTDAASGPRR